MKASAHNVPALAVSLLLHGSLLLLPILAGLGGKAPLRLEVPTNESVAFEGNSIEVDAPTPEPAAAAEQAIAVEPGERGAGAEGETETEAKTETEPQHHAAPAPARKPSAKPAASAAGALTASAGAPSAGAETPAPGAPGTFGSEGLPPGVRRVGYAMARNLPVATPADPVWKELPAGLVGTIRIEVTVEADNRVGEVQPLPPRRGEPPLPAALERMIQRTVPLLRVGQFALSGSNRPGKELLVIEVRLRDDAPDEDPKGLVVQKGFEPATPGHPGRAYFRYDTGRWFEAKVTIVPATD